MTPDARGQGYAIEQVDAVARAASTELIAAIIRVAAFTGLRQGETLALRWQHVDFASRILMAAGLSASKRTTARRSPAGTHPPVTTPPASSSCTRSGAARTSGRR